MKYIFLLSILISMQQLNAQENIPPRHLLIKKDSTYLVIDDSPGCWYTFEIKADSMGLIGDNVYYFDKKAIQFGGIQFDNGRMLGAMESRPAEVYALRDHMNWELKNQKSITASDIYYNQKFFVNKKGKPFLIWWFKIPENKSSIRRGKDKKTPAGEPEMINQMFLDFVTQGNTCVSISIPVLENEKLNDEAARLIQIANTFTAYSSPIDIDILYTRTKNGGSYIFKDIRGSLEIELPEWFNVTKSVDINCLEGSFPEKDNIINTAILRWEYKTDSSSFKRFIAASNNKNEKFNYLLLEENDQVRREFYTTREPFYYFQDIFIDYKEVFCFIHFSSTRTTYEYNKDRLDELISKIHCASPIDTGIIIEK